MFKTKSIRTRLTLLMTALLSVCCVILVELLNYSTLIKLEGVTLPNQSQSGIDISISIDSITYSLRLDAYFYLALVVIVGSIITWLLIRRFLKPIQELADCMRNTTPRTLTKKINTGGHHDEITELVNSFNFMTKQLDESFAMQKRFSAHAAHELRTPLTVIQTKLDVFEMKHRSQEEYHALFGIIKTQIQRLSSLVKSLLEFTEIDQTQLQDRIPLHKMLDAVKRDLESIGEKKGISIYLHTADNSLYTIGNQPLLYRVFYNLVENAIRYNRSDGCVDISLKEYHDKLCVCILDTGDGIPDECKPYIFEPFYRVDKSRSRALGGAGLGLSLVHSILEQHNATITVKDGESGGTVFEVTFPKKQETTDNPPE